MQLPLGRQGWAVLLRYRDEIFQMPTVLRGPEASDFSSMTIRPTKSFRPKPPAVVYSAIGQSEYRFLPTFLPSGGKTPLGLYAQGVSSMTFIAVITTRALSGIRIGHATAETGWNHTFGVQAPARDGGAKR
jgi:hypothetical protein